MVEGCTASVLVEFSLIYQNNASEVRFVVFLLSSVTKYHLH